MQLVSIQLVNFDHCMTCATISYREDDIICWKQTVLVTALSGRAKVTSLPTYPRPPFKVKELCNISDVLFNEKQIFLLDDGCCIRYGHFFLRCVLLWETQKKFT